MEIEKAAERTHYNVGWLFDSMSINLRALLRVIFDMWTLPNFNMKWMWDMDCHFYFSPLLDTHKWERIFAYCVVQEECSVHSIKLWKCICRIDLNIHSYGIYYITDGCHTTSTWIGERYYGIRKCRYFRHTGFLLRNLIWNNLPIEVNKFCTLYSSACLSVSVSTSSKHHQRNL